MLRVHDQCFYPVFLDGFKGSLLSEANRFALINDTTGRVVVLAIIVFLAMTLFISKIYPLRLRKIQLATPQEVLLQPVAPQDNESLRKLIIEILEEYGCNKKGFAAQDVSLQQMYEAYQKKGSAYFVVKKEGNVLGGAGFAPLEGGGAKVCELQKMYVDKALRGKGMGDRLIIQCLKEAKNQGYTSCYLETTKQMTQAQKLYHKHGFIELPCPLGNTGHFGCDLFFEKKL